MVLDILETLQKWIEPVREFIFKHHSNPLFWVIIILVALSLFFLTYSALNKENQL